MHSPFAILVRFALGVFAQVALLVVAGLALLMGYGMSWVAWFLCMLLACWATPSMRDVQAILDAIRAHAMQDGG